MSREPCAAFDRLFDPAADVPGRGTPRIADGKHPDSAQARGRLALCRRILADQIGGSLGDHDHGGVDVPADQVRHDRRVNHPQ